MEPLEVRQLVSSNHNVISVSESILMIYAENMNERFLSSTYMYITENSIIGFLVCIAVGQLFSL